MLGDKERVTLLKSLNGAMSVQESDSRFTVAMLLVTEYPTSLTSLGKLHWVLLEIYFCSNIFICITVLLNR